MMPEMIVDGKGLKIMQKGMGSPEMVVVKVLEEIGNIHLHVIILGSWVTSALNVISHQEWRGHVSIAHTVAK